MGCASSWMWMLMWMWMLLSILMLMMPDYATCRLCERLKGQARRHREQEELGLSLRDLGLRLGDVVRVIYVVWVLFLFLFLSLANQQKSIAAKYPSCSGGLTQLGIGIGRNFLLFGPPFYLRFLRFFLPLLFFLLLPSSTYKSPTHCDSPGEKNKWRGSFCLYLRYKYLNFQPNALRHCREWRGEGSVAGVHRRLLCDFFFYFHLDGAYWRAQWVLSVSLFS